ncbi:MAG: penicillin-binding transpeptidase domain-containing protein [Paracoccaceae bacterium]|nr:penicillin-binding transpeptidase domain-containing protein [Paracoccaceae bacterium]
MAISAPVDVSETIRESGVDISASTVVIRRVSDGQTWISNRQRAAERFIPASTSKIPHTIVALETGVSSFDTVFEWDGKRRFLDSWNMDQTLATAYQRSAVWVFQDIADAVGHAQMAHWIQRLEYGNRNIGDATRLTTYWLQGPLKISALEQIDFLERLVSDKLSVSPGTVDKAREIMRADSGPDWSLYAKTGWGLRVDEPDIGWYVGWLEQNEPVPEIYIFAFNLDMASSQDRHRREQTVRHILADIGVLAAEAP